MVRLIAKQKEFAKINVFSKSSELFAKTSDFLQVPFDRRGTRRTSDKRGNGLNELAQIKQARSACRWEVAEVKEGWVELGRGGEVAMVRSGTGLPRMLMRPAHDWTVAEVALRTQLVQGHHLDTWGGTPSHGFNVKLALLGRICKPSTPCFIKTSYSDLSPLTGFYIHKPANFR
ncbi:hypothetical protein J6590_012920 [Homalodisca vitripennis]|nr:hypothetical protein J6590_012920 [Homalodisca vitripennis]